MAALTAEAELRTLEIDQSLTHKVYATADKFWSGALLEKDIDNGLVSPLGVAGSGAYFIGYCEKSITTAASSSKEVAVNNHGDVLQAVAVTGVTGASDETKIVYCTTDNVGSDCTLTRTGTDALPIGRVQKHITSTTCDIKLFTEQESKEFVLRGAGRAILFLGTVHTTALEGTSAIAALLSRTMTGLGRIRRWYALPNGFDASYAAGSQTMSLEIEGTNVTGDLTIAATSCDAVGDLGTEISVAATGSTSFGDGDVLEMEMAASGTGFTAGVDTVSFNFYVEVEYGA